MTPFRLKRKVDRYLFADKKEKKKTPFRPRPVFGRCLHKPCKVDGLSLENASLRMTRNPADFPIMYLGTTSLQLVSIRIAELLHSVAR